ncbi:uncharacterized protein LOC127832540 [Dreissena polymorpha]|nr:uncharacterized protein LOC127832540 [Dreissena polymorpha]
MDINDMEVPEARPETFRHKSKSATPAPCPQKENATNGLFVSENVKKEEDPTVEATVATEVRGRPVSIGLVFDYKRLPKIVQQPLTQWLKAGETLKLQMEVVKSPDLKVTWFHNDTPIRLDGSERYKLVVKERK